MESKEDHYPWPQITLEADQIQLADCPTSIMAISPILKGIAGEPSSIRPLIAQLGTKVSAFDKKDALKVATTPSPNNLGNQNIKKARDNVVSIQPRERHPR